MTPVLPSRAVALLIGVCLLGAGCTPSSERMTALEERMALVEGRTAILEADPPDAAGSTDAEGTDVMKTDFSAALDAAVIQASIEAAGEVEVEVVRLELDPTVDLVKAEIRPIVGTETDIAWESAKALAPLFTSLGLYAPAIDLQVGDTRCTCSTELMKGIADQKVDRQAWEGACSV